MLGFEFFECFLFFKEWEVVVGFGFGSVEFSLGVYWRLCRVVLRGCDRYVKRICGKE